MSTHFCKVGTVRPNLNTILNSTEKKKNAVEQKIVKIVPRSKSTKKS